MQISKRLEGQIVKVRAFPARHRRLLVTHADCPDGTASAMIAVAHGFEDVFFARYGSPLPPPSDAVFVDFSPTADAARAWLEAGAIVLDHHKSARSVVEMFAEVDRGAFADEAEDVGVSGAVLADLAFSDQGLVSRFATLAGIRDTWQKEDPKWRAACAQAAGLMFFPWDALREVARLHPRELGAFDPGGGIGELLCAQRARAVAKAYASGVHCAMNAGLILLVNDTAGLASDIGEYARERDSPADFIACYSVNFDAAENVRTIRYSLRSIRDGFDVSAIAKRYGGGGHTAAAGFEVAFDWFDELDILAPFVGL